MMRWSRLYLVLSIVSLAVAVGMANCDKHHCRERVECTAESLPPRANNRQSPYEAAYDALRARDYAAMAAQADILIAGDEPEIGHALRAYALRGQGRYEDAIDQYTLVLMSEPALVHDLLRSDCYIGRAACYNALEQPTRAREDIEAAKALTVPRTRAAHDDAANYQLGCIYAIESEVNDGTSARIAHGQAIWQLRLAITRGFDSWSHMRADLDLEPLHDLPEFQDLFPSN